MEDVNISALIAKGKLVIDLSKLDQSKTYLQIGVNQKKSTGNKNTINNFAPFVVSLSTLLSGISANNTLFQELADSGNSLGTETELYANTIGAGTLAVNGDSIKVQYALKMPNNFNSKVIRVNFAGQQLYESINIFGDASLLAFFHANINVTLIRTGSTTARAIVTLDTNDVVTPPSYPGFTVETDLSALDFSALNQFVLTGEGVANDDIVAKFAKGIFEPAAAA